MTALLAGFLLVGYLLAPGAIYRLLFSLGISSKRFQRTRTEEVVFSVLVTLLPFALSYLLLLYTPLGRVPTLSGIGKHEAYRVVLNSLLSSGDKDLPHDLVARAYLRSFGEQSRFILYLWSFCTAEGLLAGWTIRRYGNFPEGSWRKRLCDKVLLRHVSEWELLLTTFARPSTEKHLRVEIDALTTMGTLYRGELDDWFVDTDGKLVGIYLTHASRYAKDALGRDRSAQIVRPTKDYWRAIPGAQLYLVASTVANYNIRYVEPQPVRDALIGDLLGQDVVITPLPAEDPDA